MKKKIRVDFHCESRKWPRRIPKIKKITNKTLKIMNKYFEKRNFYNLNLIFSHRIKVTKLNKKYKKINKDTDVLTFVTKEPNKYLGKNLYCDIFFSIDTIESFIEDKNITLYDHFNHLLVHSFLHINGYDHKNNNQFIEMKKHEIQILKQFNIKNPYLLNL